MRKTMREIKFRAWNNRFKGMDFGSGNLLLRISHPDYTEPMQYIGLKDKNGKDIYEGDIICAKEKAATDNEEPSGGYMNVRKEENFVYGGGTGTGTRYFGQPIKKVTWRERSCGFEPFSDSYENCGHCGGKEDPSLWEVIGNIYENPELLGYLIKES